MKSFILSTLFMIPSFCRASAVLKRGAHDEPSSTHPSAPGALKSTSRFGPFKLPSMNEIGAMGESGMIMQNVPDIPMPCSDCTLTYLKGDMIYEDGTSADTYNDAYMHHITLIALPKNADFGAMFGALGESLLSGAAQGSTAPSKSTSMIKPIYLTGNERVAIAYPNAGVYYGKNSSVMLSVDLQNQSSEPKDVWISMEYEYLPGKPSGYVEIVPVPQNALGSADQKQEGVWERTSAPYTSPYDARILMMYGHVHDGGIHTEIMVNGEVKCDSLAIYPGMEGAKENATEHSHERKSKRDSPGSHILSFGECKEVGNIKQGDIITTKVYYDFTKRQANVMANGKADPLMGISMTFLGIPLPED